MLLTWSKLWERINRTLRKLLRDYEITVTVQLSSKQCLLKYLVTKNYGWSQKFIKRTILIWKWEGKKVYFQLINECQLVKSLFRFKNFFPSSQRERHFVGQKKWRLECEYLKLYSSEGHLRILFMSSFSQSYTESVILIS